MHSMLCGVDRNNQNQPENFTIFSSTFEVIQSVSRLVVITAGSDFLGLCDQKFHIIMCPLLGGYGVMTV